MLGLVVVVLLTLGTPSIPQVQGRSDVPLLLELIKELVNDTLPCLGPCLLDQADAISVEMRLGLDSQFLKCGSDFYQHLLDPNREISLRDVLELFKDPPRMCPKLRNTINCLGNVIEKLCGSGMAAILKRYLSKFMFFLDCNVERDTDRLRIAECLIGPMSQDIDSNQKFEELTMCADIPLRVLLEFWDSHTVHTEMKSVCSLVSYLTEVCLKTMVRPQLNQPQCKNIDDEIKRQVNAILEYADCYGNGTGVFACLGDRSVYLSWSCCFQSFTFKNLHIQECHPGNFKDLIKDFARATNHLFDCYHIAFDKKQSCQDVVVPTFRNLHEPALDYINCLGSNSSTCQFKDSCRCLRDYNVSENIIGTCSDSTIRRNSAFHEDMPDSNEIRVFNVTFIILDEDYDPLEFPKLVEDIKPSIEKILQEEFHNEFITTSDYKGRQGSIVLSFLTEFHDPNRTITPTDVEEALATLTTANDGGFSAQGGRSFTVKRGSIRADAADAGDKSNDIGSVDSNLALIITLTSILTISLVILIAVLAYYLYNRKWASPVRDHRRLLSPSPYKMSIPGRNRAAYGIPIVYSSYPMIYGGLVPERRRRGRPYYSY